MQMIFSVPNSLWADGDGWNNLPMTTGLYLQWDTMPRTHRRCAFGEDKCAVSLKRTPFPLIDRLKIYSIKKTYVIGAMYVPPDMANNTSVIHTICSTIDDVACKADEICLLFEDFNLSNLNWIADETNPLMLQVDYESSRITDNCRLLLDCMNSNGLY